MQHFRGADAIQDVAAEMRQETLADIARQCLAGRGAHAQRHLAARGQVGRGEQAGEQCRHATENGGLLLAQTPEHRRRRGPFGHQHGGRTHRHREGQRIAQPIGKEQLGGREHDVVLADAQHLAGIQVSRMEQVAMRVHGALGPSGRARRIQPERHVVRAAAHGLRGRTRARQHRAHAARRRAIGMRRRLDHHRRQPALLDGRLHYRQQRLRHHHGARAAVAKHIGVIVCGQQGIDRHRHHARQQAAEKYRGEINGIERAQQQPLFLAEARVAQRAGKAAGAGIELGISQRGGVVDVGSLAPAPCLHIARQQVLGGVVAGGQCRHGIGSGWNSRRHGRCCRWHAGGGIGGRHCLHSLVSRRGPRAPRQRQSSRCSVCRCPPMCMPASAC
ncbi:hypothetical protein D9M72_320370 [compost metagenome]